MSAAQESPIVPEYPMPRTDPLDLPPGLAQLKAAGPVARVRLWDGSEAWLVTGWQEARAVLADNRFSADLRQPGFPHVRPGFRGRRTSVSTDSGAGATLLRMDPPEHDRLRQMLTGYFTVRRTATMRPMIQQMADDCLDNLQARGAPADIIDALAVPLPSMAICDLLGVPVGDRPLFEELTATVLSAGATQRQVISALRRLVDYLDGLVTSAEQDPGDDILGMLVRDYASQGLLGHDDLVGTARLLLTAGHETTASMLGLCLVALLAHRELWQRMSASPQLIPGAVEELLRFHTIAQTGLSRVATEDVSVAGHLIRAGEGVIVSLAAGNRDSAAFDEPDALDLCRKARHHLSFGFGVHQCLGQALARLELEIALASTMRRFPALRLAGALEDVEFGYDRMLFGVERLMVTW
jgi:cytochrome P450